MGLKLQDEIKIKIAWKIEREIKKIGLWGGKIKIRYHEIRYIWGKSRKKYL